MAKRKKAVDESGHEVIVDAAPAESKDAKFRRLADRRVPRALKTIEYVKNLSSKASYAYTDEQANEIVGALREAVNEVAVAFRGGLNLKKQWRLSS